MVTVFNVNVKDGFESIQSAIYAAARAGGGSVSIPPGIYFENLELIDRVDLCGICGVSDTEACYRATHPSSHGSHWY